MYQYFDNSLLKLFKTIVFPPIFKTNRYYNLFHIDIYKLHIFVSQYTWCIIIYIYIYVILWDASISLFTIMMCANIMYNRCRYVYNTYVVEASVGIYRSLVVHIFKIRYKYRFPYTAVINDVILLHNDDLNTLLIIIFR